VVPSELTLEQWPVDRLIDYARNPRKNDHAVEQMAAVITEFGFRIPVVAKSTGEIVDGHLRLKAARTAQGGAQTGLDDSARGPGRRIDRCPDQGISASGQSVGNLGGMGRHHARAGTRRPQAGRLRSVADRIRRRRDRGTADQERRYRRRRPTARI